MVNPQSSPANPRQKKRTENYFVPAVDPYNRARAPTTADIKDPATGRLYPIHCEWRDTATNDIWKLVNIASNLADWQLITTGTGDVTDLTPDTGGVVSPVAGNIDIVGQDTPSQNGIETFNLAAGQMGVRMKSPFTLEDFTFSDSTAGSTRTVTVAQSDDTNTASNAALLLQTGGTSGGDPYLNFSIPSTRAFGVGIDNTDSDILKITTDAASTVTPSSGTELITLNSSGDGIVTGSWTVDNLKLDGNTLSSINTDGAVSIDPDDTSGNSTVDINARLTLQDYSGNGKDVAYRLYNTDTTGAAQSNAYYLAQTHPSSAGDPSFSAIVTTTHAWTWGIDQSVNGNYRLMYEAGTSNPTFAAGTLTMMMTTAGECTMPLQPAFLAFLGTLDSNETGDGTTFTLGDTDVGTALTEVFDQGGDFAAGASGGALFTAPVTGRYLLGTNITLQQMVNGTNLTNHTIVTSNANYNICNNADCFTGNNAYSLQQFCDMDAGDTAQINIFVSGGTKIIDIFGGASDRRTNFYGHLVC